MQLFIKNRPHTPGIINITLFLFTFIFLTGCSSYAEKPSNVLLQSSQQHDQEVKVDHQMVRFDQLLEAGDVKNAIDQLVSYISIQNNLPKLHQLGLVVHDVEKAAQYLESKGIGPFLIGEATLPRWEENGEQKVFSGKLGLAQYQGIDLELLEPGEGSDFYRKDLDAGDGIVLQHLAFLVNDPDEWVQKLESKGYKQLVRGRIDLLPIAIDFAYMDTTDEFPYHIEFLRFTMFGKTITPPKQFYHGMGRLQLQKKKLGLARSINIESKFWKLSQKTYEFCPIKFFDKRS